MPDMLEPQHLINFAKRTRMAQLIYEIMDYKNFPYCLKPVPIVQHFLSHLDIYVYSEVCAIAEQYQTSDGDDLILEDVFQAFGTIEKPKRNSLNIDPKRKSSERDDRTSNSDIRRKSAERDDKKLQVINKRKNTDPTKRGSVDPDSSTPSPTPSPTSPLSPLGKVEQEKK